MLDSYRAMSTNFEAPPHTHHQRNQLEAEILRIYPNIPEQDLQATLDHTLEDGCERVGTNTNLSLSDRAERAVRAHVRHNHTLYDEILARNLTFDEPETAKANARHSVESKVRTILQIWSKRRRYRKNRRRRCMFVTAIVMLSLSVLDSTLLQVHQVGAQQFNRVCANRPSECYELDDTKHPSPEFNLVIQAGMEAKHTSDLLLRETLRLTCRPNHFYQNVGVGRD